MRTKIRYIAPLFAVASISGAVGAAPIAIADTGTAHGASADSRSAPTPPGVDGVDPLVAANTGANPFVFIPPGYDLPF